MKTLLIFFLCAFNAQQFRPIAPIVNKNGQKTSSGNLNGSPACVTVADNQYNTPSKYDGIGADPGTKFTGASFTAGSTYTLCSVDINILKVGTPSWVMQLQIYTNSGGTMIAIGTKVNGPNTSIFNTVTPTLVQVSGLNAPIIAGGTYIVGFDSSNSPLDSANYVQLGALNGGGSDNFYSSSTGTGAWGVLDSFTLSSFDTRK